jgi:hypothetical protein
MITGCGFRKTVKVFEYLNERLGWGMEELPCFNSVENRIKKSGYAVYNDSALKASGADYGMIIDESIMLGNERLLLTLGVRADKTTAKPLSYRDIEVIGIHLGSRWKASGVQESVNEDEKKMGKEPEYVISDNDAKIHRGGADSGFTRIRDVGHTLAMLLERVYKKDAGFSGFFNEISRVKIREVMSDCSYLLPPRQRTLARFMNLSHTVSWAAKIIHSFPSFTEKEKQVYRFVLKNSELVTELQTVFECTNRILSDIKTNGLSRRSIGAATDLITQKLSGGNGRVMKYAASVMEYLREEAVKLKSPDVSIHASSDMIESLFGHYRLRKSPNPLHGVTAYVLVLPLLTRMKEGFKGLDTDFKANLENVYMRDLHRWTKEQLTKNQTVKRKNEYPLCFH